MPTTFTCDNLTTDHITSTAGLSLERLEPTKGRDKASNVYIFASEKADQAKNMDSSNMAGDAKETMAGPILSGKKRASDAYNYASDSADLATKRTSERASDAKDLMSETIFHGKMLSY